MMKKWMTGIMGFALAMNLYMAEACGTYGLNLISPQEIASMDIETRTAFAEMLRAEGPSAVAELVAANKNWMERRYGLNTGSNGLVPGLTADQLAKEEATSLAFRQVIDHAARQKDAALSGLYWYTDQASAKKAAEVEGKPILYLRLLGKLQDERSCANSRFFRTVLYADPTIATTLQKAFVLCWESERPVPELTISFGDGRKLEQTITGNSAHYALTSSGRVMDVLPGLFSPQAFRGWLDQMTALSDTCRDAGDVAAVIRDYHAQEVRATDVDWQALLKRIENSTDSDFAFCRRLIVAEPRPEDLPEVSRFWRSAAAQEPVTVLSKHSVALMRKEQAVPNAKVAMIVAISKCRVEDPVMSKVRLFQDDIRVDTLCNKYLLHRRVHERMQSEPDVPLAGLNAWVYAALFKTPANDAWLGLSPANVYTGLQADGKMLEAPLVE
jgi:hypothetical protein